MKVQNTASKIVQSYFDCLASKEFQKLGSLLAEDVIWHQPGQSKLSGTYRGKNEVFGLFGKFMEVSDGSFKIDRVDSIMENQSSVVAILSFSAKNNKGEISMKGIDLMRIENEKIKEVVLFSEDPRAEDAFWDSN